MLNAVKHLIRPVNRQHASSGNHFTAFTVPKWCWKVLLPFILLLIISCKTKPKTPDVHISLTDGNRSVKFTGLDYAIISEINRDSVPEAWQGLLPVYRMPVDTDLKNYQPVQPGTYHLKDSSVVFTPDTPFVKGKTYFMRYYKFDRGADIWAFIKNKRKLKQTLYIDLIFR